MKAVLLLLVGLIILPLPASVEAGTISKESAARLAKLVHGTGMPYFKHSESVYVFALACEISDSVAVVVIADDRNAIVQGLIADHGDVLNEVEVMKRLLRLNEGGGVNLMMDEADNYFARSLILDYSKVNAASLSLTIKTVASATDVAMGAVAAYVRTNSGETAAGATPGPATARAELLGGKSWVEYDPATWKENPSGGETGRRTFRHVKGDAYVMIISERLEIPLDRLPTVALQNALLAAPDMKIVEQERRKVNGTEVFMLRMEGTPGGVPFTYLGYYYGGKIGTVQVIAYTGQNLFAEFRKDCEAFLNGLQVQQ